ncbi:MAG TPA: pyridoxal phosphate-dependent aminotransferase [Terriglobales bacterium]|jgi:aspartate/methionine/tyrosine aminotransferase|nr:pyridoxal phosphate-dependent aminotransferase [Terriglobales bacterium]
MFASRTGWALEPNRFSAALERHRASGREALDLTESSPTRCGFAYDPSLLAALGNARGLAYDPHPKGLRVAREAVCGYYRQRGAEIDPEQVILTASTSEGYSFLFRLLCDPGDEVLVPAPSYPLFEFLASIQDVKLVPYPLIYDHGWQIDLHGLSEALAARTRAILVVHPNNPTGSFVKPAEMDALDALCRERQVALVADEVFLDYAHDGVERPSFAGVAPASRRPETRAGRPRDSRRDGGVTALTFTLSGISKICALPQMKLAWVVASGAPEPAREALARLEVIADTYLSVSTPVQLALPEFLALRDELQQQVKERVAANLAELDRQLAKQQPVRRLDAEGGWYAVLRVPATRPDEDLAIELLERHSVIVHPGHFYDFPGEGYLVVSLITSAEVFAEGVKRVLGCF